MISTKTIKYDEFKRTENMTEDKIYYYTSNYVLKNWMKSQKIWATRSVTSNDASDTVYAIGLFPEIKHLLERDYEIDLKEAKALLQLNKFISKKFYKDLLYYAMQNHYEEFRYIIQNEITEREEWFYYGNEYELFKVEDRYEHCGSFHLQYLKNPNREQWIFCKLLEVLSVKEVSNLFNLSLHTVKRYKQIMKQLPFTYHPFVICFTKDRDNRFLWDSYTKNKGIALEFSRTEIRQHFEMLSSNKNYPYMLQDVKYDKNEQIREISKYINETEGELLATGPESLCSIVAKYKHPYWAVENEVRAIFNESYFEDSSLIKENYNLKYREDLISQDYIEIEIPHNLVKGIILGPQNDLREKDEKLYEEIMQKFNVSYSQGYNICKC